MPFSFKPDVIPGDAQPEQAAPPAVFGNSGNSKTISTENIMERAKSQGKSFLVTALFTIFGFLILVFAGLFAYKFFLSSQVEAKKERLASYEAKLEGIPLEDMRKLSNRLKIINQLIKDHPSVNVAFLIVEASVENMITFSKFSMQYSESAKSYELSLAGLAPDYKSVAQQMDTYARKPYSTYISKVTVGGLQPNPTGQIAITLSMPVSITGLIPETFSLIDGAAEGATMLNSDSTSALDSGTQATTSPVENIGKATTTVQVVTPQVKKP